jgi:hypothetical protein
MSTNAIDMNNALKQDQFKSQMEAFADWKSSLTKTIKSYQDWLNKHGMGSAEVDLRIYDALEALNNDRLTIAFVAEFSRGKTELINAIFFADYGVRMLPSEIGRTTMCPTELLYDTKADESYIKVLPIETRLSDVSLTDLKREDTYWTKFNLDTHSATKMSETFKEVIKTKMVTKAEAEELGLYNEEMHGEAAQIEIPLWRHAIISFPHPLLKQGLIILDTPGLNALGSEPELTLNMLPSAQAVFFILSADTGVTKSDMDMWQNHILAFRNKQQSGLIAVMNKTDTLWDEMKDPAAVQKSIQDQCTLTAGMLGINVENVFPVSAQKGLLAKIKNNPELLDMSKILTLEWLLAREILPGKQQVIWDNIIAGMDKILDDSMAPLNSQLQDLNAQLDELNTLSGNNEDVIQQLIMKAKAHKITYYESVKNFQASRKKLALQAKNMYAVLGSNALDELIQKTREVMSGSWSTAGMKKGMDTFFTSSNDALEIAGRQADQTYKLVQSIYKKFQKEHGLQIKMPPPFPMTTYEEELKQLHTKGEEFRNSTLTTVSEQSFVVKKFFITLVSHARNVFVKAHKEADIWLKDMINPLVAQIQEKRDNIEQHMDTLNKIKDSKNSLDDKVKELENKRNGVAAQVNALTKMRESLQRSTPPKQGS